MSGPYEIIKARVQQKVATEADWLAVDDELDPILPGEQAFVLAPDGVTPVNFKIGDGTKKFSELPYFIAYASDVLNQKILSYLNQNIDISISGVFRNFSCLYDIILINNSGTNITLKVGTTSGGNELMQITLPDGVYSINLRKVFSDVTTVYLSGLAGNNYSMFLVYFQYDERPVSSSGGSSSFRWPRCFKGMFEPLTDTDLDDNWDFTTGLGKTGTAYENCAISGTNGTENMARIYAAGWQVGDSLRPATTFGNATGQASITEANIPKFNLKLFANAGPAGNLLPDPSGLNSATWTSEHTSGNQDYDIKKAAGNTEPTMGRTSSFGSDTPVALDVRPNTKVVLYFVAISD